MYDSVIANNIIVPADGYVVVCEADSPLIGAGVKVEGNDLTTDIFGNKITGNNIGCYGADGEDVEYEGETIIENIIRYFKELINRIIRESDRLKDY